CRLRMHQVHSSYGFSSFLQVYHLTMDYTPFKTPEPFANSSVTSRVVKLSTTQPFFYSTNILQTFR
ncbi:MAG: hypothetical protein KJ976_03170, partial [Proteobacteria bacterium]|nr:hypothetical protein [Pseudomonadota bacterium]